jgi:hypothetical protein
VSDPILHLPISQSPVFLVNSRYPHFCAPRSTFLRKHRMGLGSFIPKLQEYFAEFLSESYLDHLGIFYQSTCVGLRYGQYGLNLEVISWQFGIMRYVYHSVKSRTSSAQNADFPTSLKAYNAQRKSNYPLTLSFCVTPSHNHTGAGI